MRSWLRRAIATAAAVLPLPVLSVVSVLTPTGNTLSREHFQTAYITAGGTNANLQLSSAINNAWRYSGAQLQALKTDLIATLKG